MARTARFPCLRPPRWNSYRAQMPLYAPRMERSGEMTTPTGAAIVTTLATFARPEMTVERVGYGAGSRDPEGRPNVLRMWLGEGAEAAAHPMVLIETNIDDMTGEMLGYVHEKLMAEGAADAWFTPIQMKKGRPGVTLSVICAEANEATLARLLLRETSTLGVRVRPVHRWEAEREVLEFESSLGPAAVKVKRLPGEPPRIAPEYEACKRLAEAAGLPLAEVYRIIEAEARGAAKAGTLGHRPRQLDAELVERLFVIRHRPVAQRLERAQVLGANVVHRVAGYIERYLEAVVAEQIVVARRQ